MNKNLAIKKLIKKEIKSLFVNEITRKGKRRLGLAGAALAGLAGLAYLKSPTPEPQVSPQMATNTAEAEMLITDTVDDRIDDLQEIINNKIDSILKPGVDHQQLKEMLINLKKDFEKLLEAENFRSRRGMNKARPSVVLARNVLSAVGSAEVMQDRVDPEYRKVMLLPAHNYIRDISLGNIK
jgi:hypothetical protein